MKRDGCKIKSYERVTPEAYKLLAETQWGGSGVVYRHGVHNQGLREIQSPECIQLEKDDDLVSVAVFSKRTVRYLSNTINTIYTRYFSTNKKYKGKGLVSSFSEEAIKKIEDSINEPTLLYNLIEVKNKASRSIVEKVGYNSIATIRTVGFSRFFPKKNKNVYDLCSCESDETKEWLSEVYKDYSFVNFDHLFKDNPYYVLRVKGEVLAGVQVYNCEWKVEQLEGLLGKVLCKTLPFLPFLNRVFNPNSFKFFALDAVYVKQGAQKHFYDLLESLMFDKKVYSAMLFVDEKSSVYDAFKDKSKNGVLDSFCKPNKASFMVKPVGVDEEELGLVKSNPVYISSYDTV